MCYAYGVYDGFQDQKADKATLVLCYLDEQRLQIFDRSSTEIVNSLFEQWQKTDSLSSVNEATNHKFPSWVDPNFCLIINKA